MTQVQAPPLPPAAPELVKYPAGALLRVKDICGDRKSGKPGLLPIVPRTWLKWAAAGKVPPGLLLGPKTRAWRIEDVLAVSQGAEGAFERQIA